ncbi:MAG: hypothetical protein EB010_11485 [Acidimicrobiia bacterium]|jgi:hypothetical protein|nr:hypothetical protein [Acidimicrobiia bacterium]
MSVNTEQMVDAYLAIRTERERILREYEANDARLKEDMAKIEAALLGVCNEINADSIKTTNGTVIRKLNERFYCSDWDNFRKYVLENEAVELLERRIHQSNFRQHLSETEQDGLPPGVNVMREFGITVRKVS